MTSISASAAAGLLVALLVAATHDSLGAQVQPAPTPGNGLVQPGAIKGVDPQPDPHRLHGRSVAA